MNRTPIRWTALLALGALALAVADLAAGDVYKAEPTKSSDPAPIAAADVQALSVNPAKVVLRGGDDAMQIVVTATLKNGEVRDASGQVKFAAADEKLLRISTSGRVTPVADGSTEIIVTLGDKSAKVPAAVSNTTA